MRVYEGGSIRLRLFKWNTTFSIKFYFWTQSALSLIHFLYFSECFTTFFKFGSWKFSLMVKSREQSEWGSNSCYLEGNQCTLNSMHPKKLWRFIGSRFVFANPSVVNVYETKQKLVRIAIEQHQTPLSLSQVFVQNRNHITYTLLLSISDWLFGLNFVKFMG